jgi:redox-sensitive bicupin YhaK (pirin superfamily)
METKEVAAVLDPPAANMVGDGFKVHNFFPKGHRLKMSPFFLLDYNAKMEFPPQNEPRGVGVHPHRGFETVTIAYHGAIAHHDSAGNSGTIYPGDVQWMTAASGILHKEYHEETFSKAGGVFQMVQLWVNLPSAYKMSKPKYQAIKHGEIGFYELPGDGGRVEVIAGKYQGIKGAANTFSPMEMYNARLNAGGTASFDLPENYNTGMMIIAGEILINNKTLAKADQFVYFNKEHRAIEVKALEESIVLVLSGAPIHEPIAQYGPFLMNRPEEIQQAISDYNQGRFGFLEE